MGGVPARPAGARRQRRRRVRRAPAVASTGDHRRATGISGADSRRARRVAGRAWRARLSRAPDRGRASGAAASTDPHEMRTLPAALRTALGRDFRLDTVADTEMTSADGGLTEKALHRLADGALIESVLMHYPARPSSRERHTLCISSQAGLRGRLSVLRDGELGFGRDLEVAEIVDQVALRRPPPGRRRPAADQHRVHGDGRAAAQPGPGAGRRRGAQRSAAGSASGARHITVSTSGVVPGIRRLTALGPQFTLAVSLHAARDAAARRPRPAEPPLAGRRGRRRRARPRRRRPAGGSATRSR